MEKFVKHVNIYVNIPVLHKEQVLDKNFLEVEKNCCKLRNCNSTKKDKSNNKQRRKQCTF
jgi:hypothetical protein